MRDTHTERERERETQAEGEAGSMWGPWHGTRSRVSRITPQAEGGAKPLGHWGCLHGCLGPHTGERGVENSNSLILWSDADPLLFSKHERTNQLPWLSKNAQESTFRPPERVNPTKRSRWLSGSSFKKKHWWWWFFFCFFFFVFFSFLFLFSSILN